MPLSTRTYKPFKVLYSGSSACVHGRITLFRKSPLPFKKKRFYGKSAEERRPSVQRIEQTRPQKFRQVLFETDTNLTFFKKNHTTYKITSVFIVKNSAFLHRLWTDLIQMVNCTSLYVYRLLDVRNSVLMYSYALCRLQGYTTTNRNLGLLTKTIQLHRRHFRFLNSSRRQVIKNVFKIIIILNVKIYFKDRYLLQSYSNHAGGKLSVFNTDI